MCRFVAFSGTDKINVEIVKALLLSARRDVLSNDSHSDGWGFVIYSYQDGGWNRLYYNSSKPMYLDDNVALLYSIRGERLYGIIHARKSYRRFLQGVSHAHPYHMRSGPYDLFFAHNGSVSRTFFRNGELPYTDSYMILRDISEAMSNHTPREAYAIVMERIKEGSTSLNSALLAFSEGGGPELLVYYFYNRDNLREKEEYYKMYRWGSYIYSATVNHYLGYRGSEIKFGDVEQVS